MRIKKFIGILLLMSCLFVQSVSAQQWRKDRYDKRWLPITDKEMARQVRANANDAVALDQLWNRSRYQHKEQPYFSALQKLKKEQPENGVVLATYCAVLMNSNMMYGFGQYKFRVNVAEGTTASLERNLEKAQALEPKLWLVYATQSDVAFYSNGNRVEAAQNAVKLCRKALELAPDLSITNRKLGYALLNVDLDKKTRLPDAIRYYKQAQKLAPADCDPSFLLLNVYRFYRPNKAEAEKAKRAVLATIPPKTKLPVRTRQFLAKQGIKVS